MHWVRMLAAALAMVMTFGLATPASAQDDDAVLRDRVAQVVAVMQGTRGPGDTFETAFLAAVPAAQLRALTVQLTEQGGALTGFADFKREHPLAATFTLRFAKGTAMARVDLSPRKPNLVSGFRIFALALADDSLAAVDRDFAALSGKAGYAIHRLSNGAPKLMYERQGRTAFAVGSSFKLYVLAVLARQVQDGTRRWSDVVPVAGKSFPGGTAYTLPVGAPVTLHTLASLMISISDNTATDMLVRLVGQQALAREVRAAGHANPEALSPMLTTAQAFALKLSGAATVDAYVHAPLKERQRLLAALPVSNITQADVNRLGQAPSAIETAEWFASPSDLAGIMDDLRQLGSKDALDILAINPALDSAAAEAWSYAGYKGGSEPGVISMTWLLRDRAGLWFTVSGSWNDRDAPIDESRFVSLMQRLVKLSAD